jgi:hypothetical protein
MEVRLYISWCFVSARGVLTCLDQDWKWAQGFPSLVDREWDVKFVWSAVKFRACAWGSEQHNENVINGVYRKHRLRNADEYKVVLKQKGRKIE